MMEKIAVLTSGGDSPGMNACIRAVARRGEALGLEVVGYQRGWEGLIDNHYVPLNENVDSIKEGGTMLKTARSERFYDHKYRALAARNLAESNISSLLAIGGNGTLQGLHLLLRETGLQGLGIPGSIDNDIHGTESIGFDTAVNTALEAIDRIRDTAGSDERLFLVEVMGRSSGQLALHVGVAGGADETILPEFKSDIRAVAARLRLLEKNNTGSWIVVVSEGIEMGGAEELAAELKQYYSHPLRICRLGHVQRGGQPTAWDRILASKLGGAAVDALLRGETDRMVGHHKGEVRLVPLSVVSRKRNPLDPVLLDLLPSLDARRPGVGLDPELRGGTVASPVLPVGNDR